MRVLSLEITTSYLNQKAILNPSVIQEGEDIFLIDCGYEESLELIANELEKHNLRISDLTGIIISHDDIDHIGGLYEIRAVNPGIKILSSQIEEPYLTGKQKSLRLQQAEDSFNTLPGAYKNWALAFQNGSVK